jgi:ABC-type protease/lipase transport system fused ATPase/permease subunit
VIFVTHKPTLLSLTDKILLLNQGAVQGFGEKDELLAKLYGGKVVSVPAPQVAGQAAR